MENALEKTVNDLLPQPCKELNQVKESVIIKNITIIFSRNWNKNIQGGKELKYISGKVHVISSLTASGRKWYRLEAEIWEVRQREMSKNTLKSSRNPTHFFPASGLEQQLIAGHDAGVSREVQ